MVNTQRTKLNIISIQTQYDNVYLFLAQYFKLRFYKLYLCKIKMKNCISKNKKL